MIVKVVITIIKIIITVTKKRWNKWYKKKVNGIESSEKKFKKNWCNQSLNFFLCPLLPLIILFFKEKNKKDQKDGFYAI